MTEGTPAVTGPQRAAILMLALGESQCSRLFELMHEDEIKDVSAAMAQLGRVPAETVEHVCAEFIDSLGNSGNWLASGHHIITADAMNIKCSTM